MNILYIDVDALRPDHLGCYGYHRKTSPHIDRIAAEGLRFDRCYAPDSPCLPSRSALFSGRFGIHTGLIEHCYSNCRPFDQGERSTVDDFRSTSLPIQLKNLGYHNAVISPFPYRHAAWQWLAGFHDVHDTGMGGMETADMVAPIAEDWLERNADRDENWFLYVNFWDPHVPYRSPEDFRGRTKKDYKTPDDFVWEMGDGKRCPEWLTGELLERHKQQTAPGTPRDFNWWYCQEEPSWQYHLGRDFPRHRDELRDLDDVAAIVDGYDLGIRYADYHIGRLLAKLEATGQMDNTIIVLSGDHGETFGELGLYGNHTMADESTIHIPLIVRWPGVTDARAGQSDPSLLYHFDFAATLLEMAGGTPPENWDARPFTRAFRENRPTGHRPYLVCSHGLWSAQRSVRFEKDGHDFILTRTFHDGYRLMPDYLLFDLTADPHQLRDLASERRDLVDFGLARLEEWTTEMMRTSVHGPDPFWVMARNGGPAECRGILPAYLQRLRQTGRGEAADALAAKYPKH